MTVQPGEHDNNSILKTVTIAPTDCKVQFYAMTDETCVEYFSWNGDP